MYTRTLLLAAFMAFAATAVSADKKIICYFGSWAVYRPGPGKFDISYIDPRMCTHMIYTFVGISTEGNVRILDAWQDLPNDYGKDGFGRFNKLRELSPGTKTIVAIGGWNEGSSKYSQVAGNPTVRAKFVQNVVAFLKKYGFDGFDLDWEYPNQRGGVQADTENYVLLLKELREAFDKEGFLLTAAVAAAESSASKSFNIREMSKHLHFINLMAYDLHGAWDNFAAINAPLYAGSWETGLQAKLNVNASVQYWLAQGAPKEKLVLGVPFYGRGFTLQNPNSHEINAKTTGPLMAGPYTREPGMIGYNEICEYLSKGGWTVVRQEEQRVPYAYKDNQWFGYDDVQSIKEKAEYINSMGLGGAMIWSIETDDFGGNCGEKYPLLRTLNHVLRGGEPVPTDRPHTNPPATESSKTQPPVTEPKPTAPPTDVCSQEGLVRDKNDCSKFYNCLLVDGVYQAVSFNCPNGLAFDETVKSCNYKDLVPGCA